jgi:HD-like signal output (HDOD) protein
MRNTTINKPASADKTMELLWSRVRQRGDLPGFSKVVGAIIGAMRGDDDREFSMTRTVLQDPALTQKVLRLANSAMYSVFGRDINTVSKAVIVLGTEAIGHLALGLKLIDGLSTASSGSAAARAEMEKAVLAGQIARQVASSATTRDAEEAVVCSMLHSLGRMLAAFYLPERWEQVLARCAEEGIDERQAVREIFGMDLDEISRQAAQHWGLPTGLINTLRDAPPQPTGEPLSHADWLTAVSTLSSRCAAALCAEEGEPAESLADLVDAYAEMLGMEAQQLLGALETAQHAAEAEHAGVVRPARRNRASDRISGKPADAAELLARGVADVRDAFDSANASQLMSMALETVYKGLGFSRVIAFFRDREQACYAASMCFGDDIQERLPQLTFGDAYQPDVFHAALANDKMIFVEDAQEPAFLGKVPRWWREAMPDTRSFMVLPLTVNHQAIGFIYGDWDMSRPAAKIEQAEIGPLDELRALVVRAVELRRQMEARWGGRVL